MLYRVVCGYSQAKRRIYAAVHRADKALHQNMYFSLALEHPEVADMTQIGGAMYLDELESGLKLSIPPEMITPTVLSLKEELTKEVIATFEKIKARGQESSLREYLTDVEAYAKIEPVSAVAAHVRSQAQDELRRRLQKEERICQEKELPPLAPAWLRFQKIYSGD